MKVGAPVAQASRNKENIRSFMGKNCSIIVILICLPSELLPLFVALISLPFVTTKVTQRRVRGGLERETAL